MHHFSMTIETRTKTRRATPTVSGMQRARMPRRSSPVLFRLFNRGELRTGLEAVAEKKRFACSRKSCADNRRRTGEITDGLSGGNTGKDQAAIIAGSRAITEILWAARVSFFVATKCVLRRRDFFGARLMRNVEWQPSFAKASTCALCFGGRVGGHPASRGRRV